MRLTKSLFLLSLFIWVILGIYLGRNYTQTVLTASSPLFTHIPTPTPTPEPTIAPTFYTPLKLTIPKLNINAEIEPVGIDAEQKMDVPKKVENVGWFNLGAKVGEKGSMVLAGHFDDIYGNPAVFYNLSKLQVDDEIKVLDEKGKEWIYKVVNKEVYNFDQTPLEQIFASNDKQYLNLITCNGIFDPSSNNYSKRLVVYTELIE